MALVVVEVANAGRAVTSLVRIQPGALEGVAQDHQHTQPKGTGAVGGNLCLFKRRHHREEIVTMTDTGWALESASNIAEEMVDVVETIQSAIEDEDVGGAMERVTVLKNKLASLETELGEQPVVHDVSEPDGD